MSKRTLPSWARKATRRGAVAGVSLLLTLTGVSTAQAQAGGHDLTQAAVFTQTNGLLSNQVVAYYRQDDGSLLEAGRFATGGTGKTGSTDGKGAPLLPIGVGNGPGGLLQGANSVVLAQTPDGTPLLFVTNAGSGDLSVFRVERDRLVLTDRALTGGFSPISVTVHGNLVYVLNQITATIKGFRVDDAGKLTPVPGAQEPVAGGLLGNAAAVGFDNTGRSLVVTERSFIGLNANSAVDVYDVGQDGVASAPRRLPSPGAEPFGFTFDRANHLLVTEGHYEEPHQGTMSTYDLAGDRDLKVLTRAQPDEGWDTCWVVATEDGKYAFTQSTVDSAIQSKRINPDGTVTVINPAAAFSSDVPGLLGGFDLALSKGSKYLYALNQLGTVSAYEIGTDASLKLVDRERGILPFPVGLAAS
jgi:6-phosphogluconolactonase (cycloisomerase 2 family)